VNSRVSQVADSSSPGTVRFSRLDSVTRRMAARGWLINDADFAFSRWRRKSHEIVISGRDFTKCGTNKLE
jgi:hypothetical protein